MKGFKRILLFALLILGSAQIAGANDTARTFLDGIKDYKEDRFTEAAAAFSSASIR